MRMVIGFLGSASTLSGLAGWGLSLFGVEVPWLLLFVGGVYVTLLLKCALPLCPGAPIVPDRDAFPERLIER